MSVNPWKVETVQAFYFLNCPECAFKTKTENMFKMHAFSNHPLSCILFEKSTKTIVKEKAMSESELEQLAEEGHKTLEELMYSEFGPPEPLNDIQMILGNQFYHSYGAEKGDTTDYIKEFLPIEEMMHPENNNIDVTCKYTNMIIKNKPTIMSEGLKVNTIATTSFVKKYEFSLEQIPSADSLIKKSLKCPYLNCDFETSRKNYLDSHIKSHTCCKHCGEVFPGKKQLTVHLTTHKPKKQYLCDFCDKDCKCRQSKWRHMKTCKQSGDKDPLLITQTMVIKNGINT